jgi:hypothetical protein
MRKVSVYTLNYAGDGSIHVDWRPTPTAKWITGFKRAQDLNPHDEIVCVRTSLMFGKNIDRTIGTDTALIRVHSPYYLQGDEVCSWYWDDINTGVGKLEYVLDEEKIKEIEANLHVPLRF